MPTKHQIQLSNKIFDDLNYDRRYCWGCGHPEGYQREDKTIVWLSRAHIIRYSRYQDHRRDEMQLNPRNKSFLCYGGSNTCHSIWDDNSWDNPNELIQITSLKCFSEFMNIIRDLDNEYFNYLTYLINCSIEKL
jgi:hypothetical protein